MVISEIGNKDSLWARLRQNLSEGNIMVSVCTGPVDSEKTGLLPAHPYALLQLEDLKDGRRLAKCKNPLGNSTTRLRYSPTDTSRWTAELRRRLNYDPAKPDKGIFWISWEDLATYFAMMCLAWAPALYPSRKTVHAEWLPNLSETRSLDRFPQFALSVPPHPEDFEVRITLQTHVARFETGTGRVSFMLFNYDGYRIVYQTGALREHKLSAREVFSDVFIFENSVSWGLREP